MKILLTADLHCNPGWLGRVEEEAAKYGLVCIAGDLLDASGGAEAVYGAAWLAELCEVPELITDGQTRLVPGRLAITTIPYFSPAGLHGSLIEEGKDLKSTHAVPWS